jgi:predicted GTPase
LAGTRCNTANIPSVRPDQSATLQSYNRSRDAVAEAIDTVRLITEGGETPWHGADADLATLAAIRERVAHGRFVLAVVGEFSSGKSFLLNALLGKFAKEQRVGSDRIVGLLATDINPSTATITELEYSTEESATAHYPSGREERIPLDRLSRFVAVGEEAKVFDATADDESGPNRVRVRVDSPFLRNGFLVADTPGLASINPAHRRATLGYLPRADAVLYLIDTQTPFTEGDASFLGIVRQNIESVFIVQTKIDLWRMRESGRETWQTAADRIATLAERHSPDTPVFPLSAREYAEGVLASEPATIASSRFPQFLEALDASLVARAGRARLQRAQARTDAIAENAQDALERYAAALDDDVATLERRRTAIEPALTALATTLASETGRLRMHGASVRDAIESAGEALRAELIATLGRAFDVADIARLRDRQKLHVIVDDTVAAVLGRFARDVAEDRAAVADLDARTSRDRIVTSARNAAPGEASFGALLDAIDAEPIALGDFAARRFDAEPGTGSWSMGIASGLRSAIVLGAVGGPAVALVARIAARFASAKHDTYMKRELQRDLDGAIFAAFDADVAAFVADVAARFGGVYDDLADAYATLEPRVRVAALGVVERALAAHAEGSDRSARAAAARERARALAAARATLRTNVDAFADVADAARATVAENAFARSTSASDGPAASAARFDPVTYDRGLVPERWRVAILGAYKRGKSSLVNTLAGARVLEDEGAPVAFAFPVHVRYGPEHRAYRLADDATWQPIAPAEALRAAGAAPVLIEYPWRLPPQLVLVHAPAFDAGDENAEVVALAAAAAANEILCCFSRQLSDRELALYARVAERGRPMTFVHTLADIESANDRRQVVSLADRYLRERAIVPERIFTVSTVDYRAAHAEGRAPAAWNELGALYATLESHAETHIGRLAQIARDREMRERLTRVHDVVPAARRKPGIFARLFGKAE